MQRIATLNRTASIRDKLMLACALVMAGVLATPAAMAHDHYRGHRDDTGKVLGALVVGAVIGGVIASSSHQRDTYYGGGYYAPAPVYYPSQGYYGNYPAYSYGTGYYGSPAYYPSYGSVNVGVVYTSGGRHYRGRHDYRNGYRQGYRDSRHYDNRRGYYDNRRGYYDRRRGH